MACNAPKILEAYENGLKEAVKSMIGHSENAIKSYVSQGFPAELVEDKHTFLEKIEDAGTLENPSPVAHYMFKFSLTDLEKYLRKMNFKVSKPRKHKEVTNLFASRFDGDTNSSGCMIFYVEKKGRKMIPGIKVTSGNVENVSNFLEELYSKMSK